MKRVFRNLSVVILVIFALSMTGCLSGQKETAPKNDKITNQGGGEVKPPTGGETGGNTTLPVYVPNDRERPQLLRFQATNIDTNIVQKGQAVKFTAEVLIGKVPLTVEYTATGGNIDANGNWVAPNKAGFYQIMAYAVDKANNLKSDPMIIDIRVAKEGTSGINIAAIPSVAKVTAPLNGPKKAITVDEQDTAESVSKYILNTNVAGATGTTATIELKFTDTNKNHIIAPNFTAGTLTFLGEEETGGDYIARYTYTAPDTVPTSGRANIEFDIYNPNNDDSDTATVSFIINTQPTVTNVAFTTGSEQVIGLSATKTLKVTASDVDQSLFGDKLTFTYNIISGGGSLSTGNNGSNFTGEVDFTAPASAQQVLLVILVQDTRGASIQRNFTINVRNPMSLVVADNDAAITGLATEDGPSFLRYAEATGDNASKYTLLKTKIGSSYVEFPLGNSSNMGATALLGGMANRANYYYKDTSTARLGQEVVWTVYNEYSTASAIKGPDNTYVGQNGADTDLTNKASFNFYPGANALTIAGKMGRGGYKTIQAKVTAGIETITATDRVRVNELPYITGVTFTDAQGNTQSLFNGTTSNIVQVPAGQDFYLSVSVADFDNEKVAPDTTLFDPTAGYEGFFINQSNTGLEATPGIQISENVSGTIIGNFVGTARHGEVSVTAPTYSNNYSMSVNNVKVTVPSTGVTFDTAADTYHYAYLHVTDGWGAAIDAPASPDPDGVGPLVASTIDYYRVGYEMVLANAADEDDRALDIGTIAGRTSYNKNLMLDFVDVSGAVYCKIKDLDTNTYWTKADGTVIAIPMAGTTFDDGNLGEVGDSVAEGTDYVQLDNAATLNQNIEWLAIDFEDGDKGNWKAGDKVYFKTYANTVVVKYQVVQGALVNAIDAPLYVTLGDTAEIRVAGAVSGTSTSASVTITEPTGASGGTLTAGTDTDGDAITNEVWTYKAPTTMPSSKTVNLMVNIRDSAGNVTQKPFTIELNRKPVMNGVKDTDGVAIMGNDYWILKGENNIKILADATDPDGAGDILRYDWGLSSSWGNLSNSTQTITYWSPIVAPNTVLNGKTISDAAGYLNGMAGNLNDGKIPFSVAARDFDKNGMPKGGYSGLKAFNIGINEAPTVGKLATADALPFINYTAGLAEETPITAVDFDAAPQYPNAKVSYTPASLNDSTVDKYTLKTQWYIKDNATGQLAQNIGSFYTTATQVTDGGTELVNAQTFNWIPSTDVRKNGGEYTIVARVSDQKTGAAKGITESENIVTITADDTPPTGTITAEWLVHKGEPNIAKIGDKIRYKLKIDQATAYDAAAGKMDIQKFTVGKTVPVTDFRDMIYSNNNTPLNYADDYLYYDVEIKAAPIAAGTAAAAANLLLQDTKYVDSLNIGSNYVWLTDLAGNTTPYGGPGAGDPDITSTVLTDTQIGGANIGVDNFIGADDIVITGVFPNVNPNTKRGKAGNWITIGDSLVDGLDPVTRQPLALGPVAIAMPIWEESTIAGGGYTPANIGTYAKLDLSKLGLPTPVAANGSTLGETAEWITDPIIFANEQKDAGNILALDWNSAAEAKALGLFKVTITDDAGNSVERNIYGDGVWNIDLKRPAVTKVTMYSYSNVDGTEGNADDRLIEKDGTSNVPSAAFLANVAALTGLTADADASTMEIMCIEFDESMWVSTLNDVSLKINKVSTPKEDISTGLTTGSNGNIYYEPAPVNKLWIALIDSANAGLHVERDTVVEVLFTDNSIATKGANDVICDAHGNEIDYSKDYTDGQAQGYLQW